jgi:hypothetical protein
MIDVWALKVGEHETVIFGIQRETYDFISFPLRFKFVGDPFLCNYHATSLGLASSTLTSDRSLL